MTSEQVYAVLSTIGKVDITPCLQSLFAQSHAIACVVVVDQSECEPYSDVKGVLKACEPWSSRGLKYVRQNAIGAARGRNFGLSFLPRTGLVFFPDDDAIYDENFVGVLVEELSKGASFASGAIYIDRTLKRGRLPGKVVDRSEISLRNVLWSFCEATLMLKLEALGTTRFDEALGVGSGTAAGGDEGADLVVRMLLSGATGMLNPEAQVFHPDKLEVMNWKVAARARSYARGRGVVLRRYELGIAVRAREFIRPALGMIVFAARFDIKNAKYYAGILIGKLEGFFMPRRQLVARDSNRS